MILQVPEQNQLVESAVQGDKKALETLMEGIQDKVFNLSLRMLGTIPDAEDAAQEILIRVMTNLASFRGESAFSTWVFRIAVNHLQNCRKSQFAQHPLSFEAFGEDVLNGNESGLELSDSTQEPIRDLLADELKLSCTNVMLQCFEPESRCIFILGTMFHLDSRIAGEVLNLTPEAYRQRLSRLRKKMSGFLKQYCGLGGGTCCCRNRLGYANATGRLDPQNLEYSALEPTGQEAVFETKEAMEQLDEVSAVFQSLPSYRSPEKTAQLIKRLLRTQPFQTIQRKEVDVT